MKTKTWIPKPFEQVIYNGKFEDKTVQVLEVNLGGKCKIRTTRNTIIKDVDINDLTPISKTNYAKDQLIVHRKYGIIYVVYGINPRSKTYHVKTVFIPELATDVVGESIAVGGKFNVSFSQEHRYAPVTNLK